MRHVAFAFMALFATACSSSGDPATADTASPAAEVPDVTEGTCALAEVAEIVGALRDLGCSSDFQALASEPLDITLPGARSVKVVLDTWQDNQLWFQNSVKYKIHYEFASAHLSGEGLLTVPGLSEFNATEYFSPERRFVLGAITYYEQPGRWALELSPYDTASADMIEALYDAVSAHAFFGPALAVHPTSEALAATVAELPSTIPVVTTDTLYEGTDYQPLTIGTGVGRLRFHTAAELDSIYLSYEDIVVLDEAPNDISVVRGLITEEFQTPLSHVNVLSQNRGTPNMGLRGATTNADLRALEGKLVELSVKANAWTIREVTEAEAQAFWDAHKPPAVTLPAMDLSVTQVLPIEEVVKDPTGDQTLRSVIEAAVPAFGGKAAHYSLLVRTPDVPIRPAFAIPVYFYHRFMTDNGFYDRVDALLADEEFTSNADVRDAKLAELRTDMMSATVDQALQDDLEARIASDFGNTKMRFRTSTNSEDIAGFPCAGCYESHSGDPADWEDVLDAIRETYASTWLFRTFEERTYYGVDHKSVGMALLVHTNFPDEEANGVAVTANPFDASGLDPAFYVNVQYGGDVEVVHPPAGTTSDTLLYYFSQPNQPTSYLSHSNQIPDGQTVLDATQLYSLGKALAAIHERFSPAYGPASGNTGWYAMDIEFKFDDAANPGEPATLYIKQARPYPGRGDE